MNKDDREIVNYLRDTYGIAKTWRIHGSKHPRICFEYNGKERQLVVNNTPSSNWNTILNRKQTLRQMLGDPPLFAPKAASATEPERILEDMAEELKATTSVVAPEEAREEEEYDPERQEPLVWRHAGGVEPNPEYDQLPPEMSRTWAVKIGSYAGKYAPITLFSFPRSIAEKFPGRVIITRLDEENWKISASKEGLRIYPYYGDNVKITMASKKGSPLFGSSPAEAIESDEDVLVYCPMETRVAVKSYEAWPHSPKPIIPPPPSKDALPPAEPPPPAFDADAAPMKAFLEGRTNLEAGMRLVNACIKKIQAECPYRIFVADDGRIVWRAPEIE